MLTPNGVERTAGREVPGSPVEVTLRSGHQLTADAAFEVLAARGRRLRAVQLDALEPGDYAVIRYGGTWPAVSPPLDSFEPVPAYGSQMP